MAPAQPSAASDPDNKQNTSSNFAEGRGNDNISTNPHGKNKRWMNNSEDSILQMDEETKGLERAEDVEVNVSELTGIYDTRVPKPEDPDETECSSSFADTIYENVNGSGLSDAEVESLVNGGVTSAFDKFGSVLATRKKKLTSHWRSFIRPLLWRCKWTELRIKELESQAAKYDREMSRHDQRKRMALNIFTVEGSGSKSLPYTSHSHRNNIMRRRRRKRVEDTTDTKSYMSHHNLFSYQGNKGTDLYGTSIADDLCNPVLLEQTTAGHGEFGINNDCSFLEESVNFMEHVLQKIEMVHSRVHKLKAQLDLVMSKNAGKFSSSENLSDLVRYDAYTSSVRSPTLSANNGDTLLMGYKLNPTHHISEYHMGELAV